MKAVLPFLVFLSLIVSCHTGRQVVKEKSNAQKQSALSDSITYQSSIVISRTTLSSLNARLDSPVIIVRHPDSSTVMITARKMCYNRAAGSQKHVIDTLSVSKHVTVDSSSVAMVQQETARSTLPSSFPFIKYSSIIVVMILIAFLARKFLRH